ncbi:hypothetical protein [Burkholderia metallica]|uniref:hypothetical protein n=1 Tax=Burkholderia metallica TaxID=488729 RepID=UPI001CF18B4D|nr:hypothetical protein [Burkholderia metallica]MCA8020314.1 hypothetical protein [Burkholderia metallica]
MSISEIFRVLGTDITEGGHVPVSALRKPKILSIGGCVTEVLAGRMSRLADVSHLWRVSVPCLMSKKVDGRTYFESQDHQLSERINFELTKQALRKLKTGGYEFLIFDPTSDFHNDYYEKDGCIISDMESVGLAPNWKWPEGFVDGGWVKVSARSYQYLEIYFHYLSELIKLSEEIGLPLIVLKRRACVNKITRDGVTGLGDPDSIEVNWWVDLLWKKIDGLLGKLNVLDLNGRFSITSFDVPYGEGKFHPIEEFYDYAAYKLMGLMRLGDDLISEVMFNVYRERASRRLAIHSERDELLQEKGALVHARDEVVQERDDLVRERNELSHQRDDLIGAREALSQQLGGLIRERDELAQERDVAIHERDQLIRERSELIREREELVRERESLTQGLSDLMHDRDALRLSLDRLTAERDFVMAREIENASTASERHQRELAALSEVRDIAIAENAANALALGNLQQAYGELSSQHDALCAQQNRLFNELRLEGGPMALRDVLPLARAWRPMLRRIGKAKRFCRRLVGHDTNEVTHRSGFREQ